MTEITSSKNPAIKLVKSLYQKKYREKENKFLLEGFKTIKSAVDSGARYDALFSTREVYQRYKEEFEAYSKQFEAENYIVSSSLFKEIAGTETPQGMLAVMNMPKKLYANDLLSQLKYENDNILILDRIQDPGNMGTIIRTADAAGIRKIVLIRGCVDIYNDKVVRSTMGSIFSCEFYDIDNTLEMIGFLKESKYTIVASALENSIPYTQEEVFGTKSCLIIGNEGNGVESSLLESSDYIVKIPILGNAESLNAAVAAGILMYKMLESKDDL